MASQIHKERTGKGFRLSNEIILRQEMYEEEDDSLPRSYVFLASYMHTTQETDPTINSNRSDKVDISASIRKSAEEWKANEINQLFEKFFPNAVAQAQQLTGKPFSQGTATLLILQEAEELSNRPAQPPKANLTSPSLDKVPISCDLSSVSVSATTPETDWSLISLTEDVPSFGGVESLFGSSDVSPIMPDFPDDASSLTFETSYSASPSTQGAFHPNSSASLLGVSNPTAEFNVGTNRGSAKGIDIGENVVLDPMACPTDIDQILQWGESLQFMEQFVPWDVLHDGM